MSNNKLPHIIEALSRMDRLDLEELTLAYSISHAQICEIAGLKSEGEHVHEHGHAQEHQMRERIKSKSTEEIAKILAPAALLGRIVK